MTKPPTDRKPIQREAHKPETEHTIYSLEQLKEQFPANRFSEVLTELGHPEYQALFDLADATGAELYLTGGIIRDGLTGAQPKDFDFIITFPHAPDHQTARAQFENFFGSAVAEQDPLAGQSLRWQGPYGTLVLAGANFGVYKFTPKDAPEGFVPIDIAFPRTEQAKAGSLGGAKDFDVQSDATLPVDKDLTRRDFTVNALAMKVTRQNEALEAQLHDYVGGIEDIKSRTLRAVADPYERLGEDKTRIMRAIRFMITKGLQIDPELEEALRYYASYEEGVPALQQLKVDGRTFVVPREKLAEEFLKAFSYDPAETVRYLHELNLLKDIFPELVNHTPLPLKDKHVYFLQKQDRLAERALSDLTTEATTWKPKMKHLRKRGTLLPNTNPEQNAQIRAQELDHAITALAYHKENFDETATVEEYLAILFKGLGKCAELTDYERDGVTHYLPEYRAISAEQANDMIARNELDSLEKSHRLRINRESVPELIHRHKEAVQLLSADFDFADGVTNIANHPDYVVQVRSVFPDLTRDPLFRILQSDIQSSELVSEGTKAQLLRLQAQMITIESVLENDPKRAESFVSPGELATHFFFPPGPGLRTLSTRIENQVQGYVFQNGFHADSEIRAYACASIINHPEIRTHWRTGIVKREDVTLFSSDKADPKQTTRMLIRALERIAIHSYTGEILEDASESHPEMKKVADRHAERASFIHDFSAKLSEDPQAILDWLENGFKSAKPERSLPCILFNELRAMYGCEQDDRFHSEGDVWRHTRMLFDRATENGFELTPELALSILFHDVAKPTTQVKTPEGRIHFFNHEQQGADMFAAICNRTGLTAESGIDLEDVSRAIRNHGLFYGAWRDGNLGYLQVRNYLPNGDNDLLYQLMVCDAQASIPATGERTDTELFATISEYAKRIDLEREFPDIFEQIVSAPEVQLVVGDTELHEKQEALYQIYLMGLELKLLNPNDQSNQEIIPYVLGEFLKHNRRWTGEYVKRNLARGAILIEKGLRGRDIGAFQNGITEKLLQGEVVTAENVSAMLERTAYGA